MKLEEIADVAKGEPERFKGDLCVAQVHSIMPVADCYTLLERVDIHLVQMKALTRQRIDMNARGVCS